jgi:hypothetical protein
MTQVIRRAIALAIVALALAPCAAQPSSGTAIVNATCLSQRESLPRTEKVATSVLCQINDSGDPIPSDRAEAPDRRGGPSREAILSLLGKPAWMWRLLGDTKFPMRINQRREKARRR